VQRRLEVMMEILKRILVLSLFQFIWKKERIKRSEEQLEKNKI